MKTFQFYFFVAALFISQAFPQNVEIKSMKAYAGRDETSFPVILPDNKSPENLTVEFDVNSQFTPRLSIVFRFCDKNWNPYQNIFLVNQGKNVAYNLNFEQLPFTVKDARYHYIGSFPDSKGYVDFPFSGKWQFYITDSFDTSIVYAHGKFFVVYPKVELADTLKNEQLEDKIYFPADLAKVFNITTNFYLNDEFYPHNVDRLEIVDNHKIEYPEIIVRNHNDNFRQFYWDGNRKFSFVARDILPVNEYREVDLRNTDKFIAKDVPAHLDGIEYSRFFQHGNEDMDGGSILTDYTNNYANYLNVTFTIRPPNEIYKDIFLTGAFNSWTISPGYKLQNNSGLYSIMIPLKRGIYDYQYVVAGNNNGRIENLDWTYLEGNSWETTNHYFVFLYYNDPNYGGYDRIIGFNEIASK
ncbi:MAG: early set domain-containing protein [Ignavibacteriaceae bacterium]